ncbi:holo-ACP synthase [Arcobacter sp. F2176]|uniref:holo-ACP synthase n=1 Tax=unclassified Arcobacter TaxID=2593671 RepID=UPI00100A81C1|nr:holo-ACP synthase [Arcobacter sp. F2176]RXJ82264.1 holo-ACP synthase [Arcobacter sp. F2176]
MIGIDVVSIKRIEKMYEKFGNKAYQRYLNDDEIKLVKKVETAAGFWAAKEAASKALACGIGEECGFHDIIISKTVKNAPLITFSQKVLDNFSIKNAHLSITHDTGFAIAVVALEKN